MNEFYYKDALKLGQKIRVEGLKENYVIIEIHQQSEAAGLRAMKLTAIPSYQDEKDENICGVQVFCHKDIFAAVYVTNLLMRVCDVLLTKPSELSFYPVPKIMIHRVGGHEMWGAIRAAEVGDGTYECEKTEEVLAMLDEITDGDEILPALCRGILRAKNAGIYNGAYEAVKLAVGKK